MWFTRKVFAQNVYLGSRTDHPITHFVPQDEHFGTSIGSQTVSNFCVGVFAFRVTNRDQGWLLC